MSQISYFILEEALVLALILSISVNGFRRWRNAGGSAANLTSDVWLSSGLFLLACTFTSCALFAQELIHTSDWVVRCEVKLVTVMNCAGGIACVVALPVVILGAVTKLKQAGRWYQTTVAAGDPESTETATST